MKVSKLLKQGRLKMGLSQFEVARKLDLGSAQFISNIERDRAPLPAKYLPILSKLLKISETDIVDAMVEDYRSRVKAEAKKHRAKR